MWSVFIIIPHDTPIIRKDILMDKVNELSKKQKYEEKILLSNILDKIKRVGGHNKFEHTSFLDLAQQTEVIKCFQTRKITNYEFQGGYEDAERKILMLYPEKHLENVKDIIKYKEDSLKKVIEVLKIVLPKEQEGKYEHRTYLGSLMKLGIERKMIGDILVRDDGADIIVFKEIAEYIENNIKNLTRFQKSKIERISISNLKYVKQNKEIIRINVKSMRIDGIVAELVKCSRSEANKIIEQERIFINFKKEINQSKKVEEGSYITIRGKGRFKIIQICGQTKSGRIVLVIEKS